MKAALLYSYGDPEQLRYEETAVPNVPPASIPLT